MQVKIEDIEMAIEFSASGNFDSEAYIDIQTGEIHYVDDAVDTPVPNDLYENAKFVCIPSKADFNLGKPLAIAFIAEHCPEKLDLVYGIFNRSGAFSKFKSLLASLNQLDNWYAFEQAALRNAALEWCNENGIQCN